jgi:hypothetical protein
MVWKTLSFPGEFVLLFSELAPAEPPPIVTVYVPTPRLNALSALPPPPVDSPLTEDLYPPAPPPPPFAPPPAPPAMTKYSTFSVVP